MPQVNDKVDVIWRGVTVINLRKTYPGIITSKNKHPKFDSNWVYDILYIDGDKEEGVFADYIKKSK